MQSITESLNKQQAQAVTAEPKSALILAGAGSGKTRVLTSRIAYLLQQNMAHPSEILAVTFTNKAAKEMLARLQNMIPINPRAMWVGTFHGLCNRLLRLHHQEAGLPATFAILDMSDQLGVIKRVMKANGIDTEEFKPREVQNFINRCKEEGKRASEVYSKFSKDKAYIQIYAMYEAVLQREGACDFAELLLRAYELLSRNEMIRHHYQERFRFILVDEFQDTNVLQYEWLKLLAGLGEKNPPNAVFAVGDDDQSIYAFRGANVGNMMSFVQEFRIREPIRLEQNYRSQGNILDAANALISNNSERMGKNLWTDAGKGEKIRANRSDNDFDEARFVCSTIQEYIDKGVSPKDIAILYRSNAQSRLFETELTRRGIPFMVYGGLRFFDRAEIKNAMAYMRLAENPSDDSAFLRVVNVPARGIGAKSIENLLDFATTNGISLFESMQYIRGAAAAKFAAFKEIIDTLRVAKDEMPLPAFVDFTVEKSGLKNMYEMDPNGSERIENLQELTSAAQGFIKEEAIDTENSDGTAVENLSALAGFVSHASLEAGENQAQVGQDAVQLMTVHASKGLEFDIVFITGLEEDMFPHFRSKNDKKALQEERRLMYVAITRARKELYLTLAEERMLQGRTFSSYPSSFLTEIPGETLKWLSRNPFESRYEVEDEDSWGSRSGSSKNYSSPYRNSSYGGSTKPSGHRFASNVPEWAKGIIETKKEKLQTQKIRAKQNSNSPYKAGININHEKFGSGVILDTQGAGDDMVLIVKFKTGGIKNLLARIAGKKITIL